MEVPEGEEQNIIAQTARLDLLWPNMYINSNDTKAILVAAPTSTSNQVAGPSLSIQFDAAFREVPGTSCACVMTGVT